jgi:signal transduction histidine kinase
VRVSFLIFLFLFFLFVLVILLVLVLGSWFLSLFSFLSFVLPQHPFCLSSSSSFLLSFLVLLKLLLFQRDFQKEGKRLKLQAVVVIDVVEGTAQEAIQTGVMHKIISARPKSFGSLETAIEWCLRSRMLRNAESARVSVPSLLVPTIVSCSPSASFSSSSTSSELANPGQRWKWRTDLLGTEPFWVGWFEDLSNQFLSSKCPR